MKYKVGDVVKAVSPENERLQTGFIVSYDENNGYSGYYRVQLFYKDHALYWFAEDEIEPT